MKAMGEKALLGLFGIFIVLLGSCTTSPTGRQQLALVAPQQLDDMGEVAFRELRQKQQIETDPRINAYVHCVARAIIEELPGGREGWEVAVFRDDSANAFALPAGKIGVNTGLLEVARNQDQLAAVIGHEVAHVLSTHHNERLSQQLAVRGSLGVIDALAGGQGTATQQGLMALLGLGAQVGILLPYSRIQEKEADLVGLELMARAGFDPRQTLALWDNMARAGGGQPPEFFSTHPAYGTRSRQLEAHMGTALQIYQAARAQGRNPRCNSAG